MTSVTSTVLLLWSRLWARIGPAGPEEREHGTLGNIIVIASMALLAVGFIAIVTLAIHHYESLIPNG